MHQETPHSSTPVADQLATLNRQMLRPAIAGNIDGGFELGWGTALLLFALIPYLNAILPNRSWASGWAEWLGYVPLACAAFAPYAIPKLIKRFITWPRTGYVSNAYDVKFLQLVRLIIFGGALGFALSLPFVLFVEIRAAAIKTEPHLATATIVWHGIKLLICTTVVVFLWRKVIQPRKPIPTAYDATLINQAMQRTEIGRKTARRLRFGMFLIFAGLPIALCAVVLGLIFLTRSAGTKADISWAEVPFLAILVATNSALYLMSNGFGIQQHRWKWFFAAAMIVGAVFVAPVSYPTREPIAILQHFPPVSLSLGFIWCLSGAVTLLLFIRRNPLPGPESS